MTVAFGDFIGLEFEVASGFEVNKEMRTGRVVEVDFVGEVVGVEDDDLMLVVAEMAKGIKQSFLFVGTNEGIGEKNN